MDDDTTDAWWAQAQNEEWQKHVRLANQFKQELINNGYLRKPKEANEISSETDGGLRNSPIR